jgi:hypothetical protein
VSKATPPPMTIGIQEGFSFGLVDMAGKATAHPWASTT